MPSNKVKVYVENLALGMYVSELDRPWLGSPFLFQGFMIQTEQELRRLRRHCRHVYVDVNLSSDFNPPEYLKLDGATDISAPVEGAAVPRGTEDLRRMLDRDFKIRRRSRHLLENVFHDVRFGNSVATEGAREIVRDLVDSISEDANTALWLTNLKSKDEYTLIHSMNVCVLAIAFGRHLGFDREALEFTGLGALLHDVGKMRTPSGILNKAGPLTAEEFEVMRRHPVEGFEMIRGCDAIPAESLEIIRFHHERVNGGGYPDALAGDSIPIHVLVAAIADVYDALTSDRCYRDGMPAPAALRLMYELAERDFGQPLVESFIKCMGIYPVGSLVELSNGGLGVVLSADQSSRLRPIVMLVRESSGEPSRPRRLINLAAMAELESWNKWSVRSVVDPKSYGIDLHAIIEDEVRQDRALA